MANTTFSIREPIRAQLNEEFSRALINNLVDNLVLTRFMVQRTGRLDIDFARYANHELSRRFRDFIRFELVQDDYSREMRCSVLYGNRQYLHLRRFQADELPERLCHRLLDEAIRFLEDREARMVGRHEWVTTSCATAASCTAIGWATTTDYALLQPQWHGTIDNNATRYIPTSIEELNSGIVNIQAHRQDVERQLAQLAEQQRLYEEELEKRKAAEVKAEELFKKVAGIEAYAHLRGGKLAITGSLGTKYNLTPLRTFCVERPEDGARLCAMVHGVPLWDHLLGLKLVIENDEPHFLKIANVTGGRPRHSRRDRAEAFAEIRRDVLATHQQIMEDRVEARRTDAEINRRYMENVREQTRALQEDRRNWLERLRNIRRPNR